MPAVGNINPTNLGSLATAQADNGVVDTSLLPAGIVSVEDDFWQYSTTIDTTRWNKSYPYQLLLLDVQAGAGGYKTVASYTLPIPPQEQSISTPFAITTQVTLGGITEQHNGAPLRSITLSGTTGVWPGRSSLAPFQGPNLGQSVFAGTVQSVTSLVSNVTGAAAQVTPFQGQMGVEPNASFATDTGAGVQTGYYQMRLMQQFLESYVTAKKTNAGRSLRLALAIWKDQAVYLVTPASFLQNRSGNSPWEYTYTLNFRAWKRIDFDTLDSQPMATVGSATNKDPTAIQKLVAAVAAAQNALQVQNLVAVLQGATGDAGALLENLRSLSAWGKDQLGAVYSMADLPDQIVNSLKGTAVAIIANPNLAPPNVDQVFQQLLQDLGVSSGKAQTGLANPNGLGQNLNIFQGPDAAHSLNTIFANPKQYYQYFSSVNTSDLNIPPTVQSKITAERNRVRAFTRQDFANILSSIQSASQDFADFVGAGDATFDATFNRTPLPSTRVPSDNDFEVMFQLNAVVMQLNRQAAYNNLSAIPTNPMDFAAGFFSSTQIPFQSYPGKFAVPFPYGASFETLAAKYLGDPDRWEEIVSLNDLRQPYVDEVGFTVPLLTNGNGNQVAVASDQNLEVNQVVFLSSAGQPRTMRHILSITPINNGSYFMLVLDGLPNLGNYRTIQGASLQAFMPGTVNSMMTLYIPSSTPPPVPEFDTPGIPGLNPFQQYFNAGGVDLLLTSTGNLVVTPDGDCRLAIGLTNLVQTIWLAFNTPKGSLIHHTEYGFPRLLGQSIADAPASSILMAAKNLFKGDPSFTGVQSATVQAIGPTARIFLGVGIAGTSNVLPVTFDVH